MDTPALLPSEVIEPLIARTIGQLFREYQNHPEKKSLQAAKRFWLGMRTLATLLNCNGAIHAQVAMQNEMRTLAHALVKRAPNWRNNLI